jgi:TRAP-type C4-dicarboxylate transport system permease small subunit
VAYFDNVKAWLQEGSTLTLMGGLRGLGTRLTLWLALLGASLATSAGKHIHVDLLFRALPKRLRLPAAVANYFAAAAVCSAAVWGFVDHIAIESFGVRAAEPPAAKVSGVTKHVGQHLFLARKQIVLDLRTFPRVLAGTRYDQWMTAPTWNAWLKGAGYDDHYPGADLTNYIVPEDSPPHVPLVISPDGEPARGILVHSLSLVFPFGLLMIALRFLLRAVLSVSGHLSVDPDEAHKEDVHGAGPASAAPSGGV